jgi:hypothetical protein
MIVESKSLMELLLMRPWLIMVQGSRNSCGMNKEQASKVSNRIQEIDAELTRRIIDGVGLIKFNDENFDETLKEIRKSAEDSDAGT